MLQGDSGRMLRGGGWGEDLVGVLKREQHWGAQEGCWGDKE